MLKKQNLISLDENKCLVLTEKQKKKAKKHIQELTDRMEYRLHIKGLDGFEFDFSLDKLECDQQNQKMKLNFKRMEQFFLLENDEENTKSSRKLKRLKKLWNIFYSPEKTVAFLINDPTSEKEDVYNWDLRLEKPSSMNSMELEGSKLEKIKTQIDKMGFRKKFSNLMEKFPVPGVQQTQAIEKLITEIGNDMEHHRLFMKVKLACIVEREVRAAIEEINDYILLLQNKN